jgi:hypothetical protein
MLVSGAASSTPSAGGCNERHTITANGGASHSTSQSKIGSSSIDLSGSTTDYLSVPDSADWDFGTNDFTIEGWFYPTDISVDRGLFHNTNGSSWGHKINFRSGQFEWYSYEGSGHTSSYSATVNNNAWNHFAATMDSGTRRLYLNGVQIATNTSSSGVTSSDTFYIGSITTSLTGYLDEFRISNSCRYPSGTTFTPSTTAFTEDANTLLLIHSDTTNGSTTFVGCGHT